MGPRVENKKREKNSEIKQDVSSEREFRCKCMKTYKSYPALYTHIKNKHKDQLQEYKSESIRPKQPENENKGRPKKPRTRPPQADIQGDLLNIIELGVLQIEDRLKNKFYSEDGRDKFQVLTGNAKLMYADLRKYYDNEKAIVMEKIRSVYAEEEVGSVVNLLNSKDLNDLKTQPPVKIFKQPIKFKQQLIQHFNAITAAKIIIHLQLLEIEQTKKQQNPIDEKDEITFSIDVGSVIKLGEDTLWRGVQGVVQAIRQTVGKWREKIVGFNSQAVYVGQNASQQSDVEIEGEPQFQSLVEIKQEGEKEQRNGDQIMDCIDAGL